MDYRVIVEEYKNAEFGWTLYSGDIIQDGEIEPDLMADLQAGGVIEPLVDAAEFDEDEPEAETVEDGEGE